MLSTSSHAGRRLLRTGCLTFGNGSTKLLAHNTSKRGIFNLKGGSTHIDPSGNVDTSSNPLETAQLSRLNLPEIDAYWQLKWAFRKKDWIDSKDGPGTKKAYILPMFPYPSGDLHLGHLRVYTISDVLARFKHMQGYNVLHPIGWDAFGLPAENAAIERGIDPAMWTWDNIQKMKVQLTAMNGRWDWDREFATCEPKFYKHTQRLFLLLHERGLAYQAESLVNYDPVDKTVLANEQVDANGKSWRSGAKVEKKLLKQWFFKISEFRQELLDDLEHLAKNSAWPERVLAMQKNWIGKSEGARIKFRVIAYNEQTHSDIEVFTTRPDTLFGVQYVALASTHPIVQGLAKSDTELQAFLDTIPALPPDSKVGYLLPQVRAINPLAYEETTPDATKASLPIFVAPYVLGDYGDGAVMGVPGHDTRDHAFWKHNRRNDPVRMVIAASPEESTVAGTKPPFIHHGHLTSHSGPYAGLTTAKATKEILALLESKDLGSAAETWRLRDWLVSRQRYWGTPIPIIHCESCGAVTVPEDQLPVQLPAIEDHWTQGKTGNPLDHVHDWINTPCPKCGSAAKRDTDTMDTFVDSSWYFMRFLDADNDTALCSPEAADACLPVDIYIGGVEHAILHLLYARFISKFLATTRYWPPPSSQKHLGEPFKKVLAQGMVHGKTYSDPVTGRFLKPEEVDLSVPSKPRISGTKQTPNVSFEKMSKSKYNGVDPGICMAKYGADATRAHILFQAPVSEILEWDEERISGVTRWLRKLYEHIHKFTGTWIVGHAQMRSNPKSLFLRRERYIENMTVSLKASKLGETSPRLHAYAEDIPDGIPLATQVPGQEQLDDWLKHRAIAEPEAFQNALIKTRDGMVHNLEIESKLWRAVQKTITNITESYSKTYSLNTVVSDLMTLTNTLIETTSTPKKTDDFRLPGEFVNSAVDPGLNREATLTLLKMMAPITPAFSEQCWEVMNGNIVNPKDNLYGFISYRFFNCGLPYSTVKVRTQPRSIFNEPFPEPDGTYELLAPQTMKCAVQVNGKLRCAVDVPIPDAGLSGEDLQVFIVRAVIRTEEGKALERKVNLKGAKKIVVVRGGKTVNFVV